MQRVFGLVAGLALLASLAGALLLFLPAEKAPRAEGEANGELPAGQLVVGYGRLEPPDGVSRLSASGTAIMPIVARLHVAKGARVAAGELVAELDDADYLRRAVAVAAQEVVLASRRLEQAKAGAKAEQIAAQQALVERADAELKIAEREAERARALHRRDVVSMADRDQRELAVTSGRAALAEAKATLASLSAVREVDIRVAEAEHEAARGRHAQMQAQLERSLLRAPHAGTVTEIFARAGEQVGPEGVVELVDLDRLQVVAEIDETWADLLRIGQSATIESRDGRLLGSGRVQRIGGRVGRHKRTNGNPETARAARVVEVLIAPEEGTRLPPIVFLDLVVKLAGEARLAEAGVAR